MTVTQLPGRRTEGPAAIHPGSTEARRPIVLLGDELDCLHALRSHPDITVATRGERTHGHPLAAVIQIDLSSVENRTDLKARLRAQIPICTNTCEQTPSIQRLLLIIDGPPGVPESVMHRMCDATADRLHRHIEQRCGTYIILTILLVTGCDNPSLLAHRTRHRALQAQGIDATSTLTWKEIAQRPIGHTAANHYS
ncbi:hypothetical protein E3T61_21200 [Cryobacterium lactosi]|uniref:Uncharacterized protein n=1 Tax=Cryobacterium lactosi TaxID=1259202 RepID=A0A4R9BFY8_9MICO|nr:hypothetical protein [Cryobacterium lactosi]TFD83551.1 hypothetical protein E3T61_21200 [Cryobacterium lactosi]